MPEAMCQRTRCSPNTSDVMQTREQQVVCHSRSGRFSCRGRKKYNLRLTRADLRGGGFSQVVDLHTRVTQATMSVNM